LNLRERLILRTQPMLRGERIQQIFLAQSGPSPRFGGFLGQSGVRRRIVAVTDRSIVVFDADLDGTRPQGILRRLPRDHRIGPAKGGWARIDLGGDERAWSHGTFHAEITAADAALATVAE
jgi:hypothetical protein